MMPRFVAAYRPTPRRTVVRSLMCLDASCCVHYRVQYDAWPVLRASASMGYAANASVAVVVDCDCARCGARRHA
jgi:hypothetical protein